MKVKRVKKLVIDIAKWRCGGNASATYENPETTLGDGSTALLNPEGYMCCLGQFQKQLGADDDSIMQIGSPCDMEKKNVKAEYLFIIKDSDDRINSFLADDLMSANDNLILTVRQRVEAIRERLEIEP